jgi:hypothetical protein
MSRPRRLFAPHVVFTAIVIALSLVLVVLAMGWYPIATVNGSVIWATTFRNYLSSAVSFQQAASKTYVQSASSSPLLLAAEQGAEALGAAGLDDLVAQTLIAQGLDEYVGNHAYNLVSVKLTAYRDQPELAGASRALFQLDPEAFTTTILAPQASREVLSGRLYIDNTTLDTWLSKERADASVHVFSSSYHWNGSAIAPR